MKLSAQFSFIFLLLMPLSLFSQAQPAPPRIFFSDLESGPNTGGQNNRGVWVTIWGKGFGAERKSSTVTIGGGAAAEYPIWTDSKITFQLGPAAKTGNIVVNVRAKGRDRASDGHAASAPPRSGNGLPFTVRAGKIYFVAVNGSDRQKGSFDRRGGALSTPRTRSPPGTALTSKTAWRRLLKIISPPT